MKKGAPGFLLPIVLLVYFVLLAPLVVVIGVSFNPTAAAGNTDPQGIADPPASTKAEPVAISLLDVGSVPLVAKRPVVDRDTETSLDLAMPPIAVKKQAPIDGPAVDTVMTDMGTRNPYDSDDEEDLPASLEEAVQDLFTTL